MIYKNKCDYKDIPDHVNSSVLWMQNINIKDKKVKSYPIAIC